MHEASLINSLLRKIETLAQAEKAQRVVGVSVWLGALSHMSAEHFAEHFRYAAAGTCAEDARLQIDISNDTGHPHAQRILLRSIDLETDSEGAG